MGILDVLLILTIAAVVVLLFAGMLAFTSSDPQSQARQNRLMRLRVGAQAAAILLLALLVYFSR